MKKNILILLLLFSSAFALDYSQYCTTKSPKKTFSGVIMSTSGLNFLTKNIIEFEISKKLKKELSSDFQVHIDNFYGVNILNGIFQGLNVKCKRINFNNFYVSNIEAQTLCKYNRIAYSNNEIKFKENMILKYTSEITQNDFNSTINSTQYKKILDKMNNDERISKLFKINSSDIEIKNNKIVLKYTVYPLPRIFSLNNFIKPVKLSINSSLTVKDGQIQFDNPILNTGIKYVPHSIINLLNPINYTFDATKTKKGKLTVENVNIKNNKIYIEGYVIFLKD